MERNLNEKLLTQQDFIQRNTIWNFVSNLEKASETEITNKLKESFREFIEICFTNKQPSVVIECALEALKYLKTKNSNWEGEIREAVIQINTTVPLSCLSIFLELIEDSPQLLIQIIQLRVELLPELINSIKQKQKNNIKTIFEEFLENDENTVNGLGYFKQLIGLLLKSTHSENKLFNLKDGFILSFLFGQIKKLLKFYKNEENEREQTEQILDSLISYLIRQIKYLSYHSSFDIQFLLGYFEQLIEVLEIRLKIEIKFSSEENIENILENYQKLKLEILLISLELQKNQNIAKKETFLSNKKLQDEKLENTKTSTKKIYFNESFNSEKYSDLQLVSFLHLFDSITQLEIQHFPPLPLSHPDPSAPSLPINSCGFYFPFFENYQNVVYILGYLLLQSLDSHKPIIIKLLNHYLADSLVSSFNKLFLYPFLIYPILISISSPIESIRDLSTQLLHKIQKLSLSSPPSLPDQHPKLIEFSLKNYSNYFSGNFIYFIDWFIFIYTFPLTLSSSSSIDSTVLIIEWLASLEMQIEQFASKASTSSEKNKKPKSDEQKQQQSIQQQVNASNLSDFLQIQQQLGIEEIIFLLGGLLLNNNESIKMKTLSIIALFGKYYPEQSIGILALLFYELEKPGNSNEGEVQLKILQSLNGLGYHSHNIFRIYKYLLHYYDSAPSLQPIILQLFIDLWKIQDRVFYSIEKLIKSQWEELKQNKGNDSFIEKKRIALSKAIYEICKESGSRGIEFLEILSEICNQSQSVNEICYSLLSFKHLCISHYLDFSTAWKVINKRFKNDEREIIIEYLLELFYSIIEYVKEEYDSKPIEEFNEFTIEILTKIITYLKLNINQKINSHCFSILYKLIKSNRELLPLIKETLKNQIDFTEFFKYLIPENENNTNENENKLEKKIFKFHALLLEEEIKEVRKVVTHYDIQINKLFLEFQDFGKELKVNYSNLQRMTVKNGFTGGILWSFQSDYGNTKRNVVKAKDNEKYIEKLNHMKNYTKIYEELLNDIDSGDFWITRLFNLFGWIKFIREYFILLHEFNILKSIHTYSNTPTSIQFVFSLL